jgi:hypothetical protein
MNANYKDFIATYTDVFPDGYCKHLIDEFERLVDGGAGITRQRGERASRHQKDDMQLFLNIKVHEAIQFQDKPVVDIFFNGLQQCYESYTDNFSVLKEANIRASVMKMQRTSPGGGYHLWHNEQSSGRNAERVVVYMLYLNSLTLEEAGETEFLYQQTRLQPQENTMVLWPAAYTHTHRGNTVFGSNCKYIVTGWFYYD